MGAGWNFKPITQALRLSVNSFLPRFNFALNRCGLALALVLTGLAAAVSPAHGEAMLQLFNMKWTEIAAKMPEIAEAGYDSLWVPNPGKGESGAYSVGYDLFDPFDLGDKNQKGTVATHYGTKAELLQMVETAHRFGIRVYFDNIMNHRAFAIPGNYGTPTNYYPGLIPQDFHLQTTGNNTYANWPSISDWNNQWEVQNQPLGGLIDLANEPGSINDNFGTNLGDTINKPVFVRQPNDPEYYMDPTKPAIEGSSWHPFNGTNGVPVAEDVNSYLIRAVLWELSETKCDGFRLDAVKHVPSNFFGDSTATFNGYNGAIQAMFDCVHGYGTNVDGNGYFEPDDSRNSCFNTETPRNDALLFGEHLGQPPSYSEYIAAGMRLLNSPLRDQMNNALNGNASLLGMDQRDYTPYYGAFSPVQSVMFAQSHDASGSYAAHRELQNAYYFMHEGMAVIYSDGYNQSGPPNYFPSVAYANYLGEYNDNQMPDVVYLHNQLARGGTWGRWSDQNVVAFERYDYREASSAPDQDVVLFAMNDKYSYPGDVTFDDGVGQTYDGYYGGIPISNSKGQGLVVGFPPGSVLVQLASSSPTVGRAYQKLLVHAATTSLAAAQADASRTNADPTQRLIYVGSQAIPSGGGAIELNIPSGSWVMYGYQWPEASRVNDATNAITFRQGGGEVPHVMVGRRDGRNGDPNFDPLYPFKMRGSVDQYGNVLTGNNVSNLTYAIDIPIVTNANFDIVVRSDASCSNTLVKLDGGVDLNSQMGLGPLSGGTGPNGPDLRDQKPGYATDIYLGYEQTAFQFRDNPEKFAAKNTLSNTIVSLGAETYYYTVGTTNSDAIIPGSGFGHGIGQTAAWIYHDPADGVTATNNAQSTQRVPYLPNDGQPVELYIKIGYANYINTCFLYYTTDGSNPEGAFGVGKGTTQVVQATYLAADAADPSIDWWHVTLPGQPAGTPVRYKIGTFYGGSGGSLYAGANGAPISDAEGTGAKYYGITQAAITNFNPTTAVVWTANDLNTNNTTIGLQPGFHIVRARVFLPRPGKSSVFNTFSQTFYYDGGLPTGILPYPANNSTLNSRAYTAVVRADSTTTGVEFNIQDGDPSNDDVNTGQANGNGNDTNGNPIYVAAGAVTPDSGLTAQYPNDPQEFRFVYTNIPTSGTATINVRLKEFATSVYTNRYTTLAATVNTLAPAQVVEIAAPATDGTVLTVSNTLTYLIQGCFSTSLTSLPTNFNLLINGQLQPQSAYTLRPAGSGLCANLKSFYYNWQNPPIGTNVIQLIYTNALAPISDTRLVTVAPPLKISGLANNNQLVVWDSAPGVNYQVLATTNLAEPFLPISGIIPGAGTSTYFYDPTPAGQKFYQIEVVP
jgi:hypothetical protein